MSLTSVLEDILKYLPVRIQNDANRQALKKLVDIELANEVRLLFPDCEVKGHTQQTNWADVPWLGIHDRRIDSKPTTGIYVTILFKVDGTGISLSIQHGTEDMGLKDISNLVAGIHRELRSTRSFSSEPLILRPTDHSICKLGKNSRPGKYEIANILGKEYSANEISSNLENDLISLVDIYRNWVLDIVLQDKEEDYQETDIEADMEGDAEEDYPPPDKLDRTNVKRGSQHPPRSLKEGWKALKKSGNRCEVDPSHNTFFTASGKMFMEKHHFIPMEKYFDFDKSLDHYSNIYALCPNCHKKIHNARREDKRELINFLFAKRESKLSGFYNVNLSDVFSYYKV